MKRFILLVLPLVIILSGCSGTDIKYGSRYSHKKIDVDPFSFPWGEEVEGITSRLIPAEKKYFLGSPVKICLEVRNNRKYPLNFFSSKWDGTIKFKLLTSDNMEVPIICKIPYKDVIRLTEKKISPGETACILIDINKCYKIKEIGLYRIFFYRRYAQYDDVIIPDIPSARLLSIVVFPEEAAGSRDGGDRFSDKREKLYREWLASARADKKYKRGPFGVYLDSPAYNKLIGMPGADKLFLKGLSKNQYVRQVSSKALGYLKTNYTFKALVKGLSDENMFYREKNLRVLAGFRQERCIPHILNILKNDPEPQLRRNAAYELQKYNAPQVKNALMQALKDKSDRVVSTASYSLGVLQVEQAIDLTYRLILQEKNRFHIESEVGGLRWQKNKKAVEYLIKLMETLPKMHGNHGKQMVEGIKADIRGYAGMTKDKLGPVPDTLEQYKDWWKKAGPLFTDEMVLISKTKPVKAYKKDEFGSDPKDLELKVSFDSGTYRPGDPIRMDLMLKNKSKRPYKTIIPESVLHYQDVWEYNFERIGKNPSVLIKGNIGGRGENTVSPGPAQYTVLGPDKETKSSVCLQYHVPLYWNIWPLEAGSYKVTLTLDTTKYPGETSTIKPHIHGRWTAPSAFFKVSGTIRKDPEELLALIAEKTGKKWLKSDLTSPNPEREKEAWLIINAYGDKRLLPLLEKLAGTKEMKKHNVWRIYKIDPLHRKD